MVIRRKCDWKKDVTAENILYWMLSLTIMIDFLNGLVPQISVGSVCRFVLLAITIYVTAINSKNCSIPLILCGAFFFFNTLFSFLLHGRISGIVYDLKMMMRVLTSMCICSAVISLYHRNKFSLRMIQKVIENNLLYTPALFIVTYFLGIGNVSYEYHSVGFKSVFLSLNSINVALIVMFAYAVFQVFATNRVLLWSFLSLYLIVPMLMLGTKTALALVVLIPAMCLFLSLKTKKGWSIGVTVGLIVLILAVFLLDDILSALQGVLERQLYLFQNRDLISYLFSGRNWVLEDAIDYYAKDYSILDYLFGQGYYRSHHEISTITGYLASNDVRPIEMDWADILLAYGPIGFIPTYMYSFKILLRSARFWKNKNVQPYWVTSLLIIAFGSLAGHVYVEAISSTFLAFILCAVYMSSNDLKCQQL